jgi:hypothetical protein
MSAVAMIGFETGDLSELPSIQTGSAIQLGGQYGAYCIRITATNTSLFQDLINGRSDSRIFVRFNYRHAANLTGLDKLRQVIFWYEVTTENVKAIMYVTIKANGDVFVEFQDATFTTLISSTFAAASFKPETWHSFQFDITNGTSSPAQVWVDGKSIGTTSTGNFLASTWYGHALYVTPDATLWFDVDDYILDTASLPGVGGQIARQGLTGTPTYNAWTKNGAATSALCWSNTPFTTGTNCSDSVLNDAQTMLVAPFNVPSAGDGPGFTAVNCVVNGCKVAMISKTASAGNITIRRRVGGADTDATVAITTTDGYDETPVFTDTITNINSYEIGVVNAQTATLQTVEDMWMMVDYTLVDIAGQGYFPSIVALNKMVGY